MHADNLSIFRIEDSYDYEVSINTLCVINIEIQIILISKENV